jgi:xylulokinase
MHVPAAVTGSTPVLYGPTQSSGDSLVWFAEFVGRPVTEIMALAATAPAGAGGVIFLPYLAGERAPLWDSAARGALVGLHREHGAGVGARAVLEGVAMSVRHVLETCGVVPDPNRTLRVAGGGARDAVWNQIRADVTGLTVEVVEQSEATLLGAAMLGAVGAGLYPDLPAASAMIQIGHHVAPDPARSDLYQTLYARYRALYPALTGVFSGTPAA